MIWNKALKQITASTAVPGFHWRGVQYYVINKLCVIVHSYTPCCSWKLSSTGWVYAGSVCQYSPAWKTKNIAEGHRDHMNRTWKNKLKNAQWLDVTEDHSLLLVQELLQSIQEKAETLMTEIINPTREKREPTNKKISHPIFSQNYYCPAGLLWAMLIHRRRQTQTILY